MSKPKTARALATQLLNDRAYLKKLKARLRDGTVAVGLEVALWTWAHGRPEPSPSPQPEVPKTALEKLAKKLMALPDEDFGGALAALSAAASKPVVATIIESAEHEANASKGENQ